MNILITGGTGFIGQKLVDNFSAKDHNLWVVTRRKNLAATPNLKYIQLEDLKNLTVYFDVIINLAGKSLASWPWNKYNLDLFSASRIDTTNQIVKFIKHSVKKPRMFVSASASGIYPSDLTLTYNEDIEIKSKSYLSQLCHAWESSAKDAQTFGVNTAIIRLGIVLGQDGGFFKKLKPIFKLGLGSVLGTGQAWMSWIHIQDVIGAIEYLIEKQASGIFNLSTPNPVTNLEYSQMNAALMHRPLVLSAPRWLLKLFLGRMADDFLLQSQKMDPKNLTQLGYLFEYPTLNKALKNLLN